MTTGDLLFLAVFAPLAAFAIWRSANGDGVEVPSGARITVLAILGVIAAAVGEFLLLTNGFSHLD